MTADHHRHVRSLTTKASVPRSTVWMCRVCHRTNGRGWQVCRACGAAPPGRRAWMQARPVRSLGLLLTAIGSAAIGVVVLNGWGEVISGPWVLPAIGVWVLGSITVPLVAWIRRS